MRVLKIGRFMALAACAGLAACVPPGATGASGAEAGTPLVGTEWRLADLGGRPAGTGAQGMPATLLLAADGRASGFAGCNRFAGGYTLSGTTLRLSELVSTRMACSVGTELEQAYLPALEAVRSYRLTADGLELLGDGGVLARFVAGAAPSGGA